MTGLMKYPSFKAQHLNDFHFLTS